MDRVSVILGMVRDVKVIIVAGIFALQALRGSPPAAAPIPVPPPPPGQAPYQLPPYQVQPQQPPAAPYLAPPVPPPPGPAAPMIDPAAATVQLRIGNIGCTATILANRPSPGRYYVLSAHHCVRDGGAGSVVLRDGRQFTFSIVRTNPKADLALLVIDAPDGLPTALVAEQEPGPNVPVWHQGYGVDKPGNREQGTTQGGLTSNGQLPMRLSVSSGDSGSGVFRSDNNQLVAVVASKRGGMCWGGSVTEIRRLLSGACGPNGCPACGRLD